MPAAWLLAALLVPAPAPAVDASIHFERAMRAYAEWRYEDALAEYQELAKLDPANQEYAAKLRELQPDEMA